MLPDGESLNTYLGNFHKHQKDFEFSVGQRIVLEAINEFFNKKNVQNETITEFVKTISSDESNEMFEEPISAADELVNLPNYIGSLMLTICNDAKPKTLSANSSCCFPNDKSFSS